MSKPRYVVVVAGKAGSSCDFVVKDTYFGECVFHADNRGECDAKARAYNNETETPTKFFRLASMEDDE